MMGATVTLLARCLVAMGGNGDKLLCCFPFLFVEKSMLIARRRNISLLPSLNQPHLC